MDVTFDRGAKKRTKHFHGGSICTTTKEFEVRDNVASSSKNGHSSQVKNASFSESFSNRNGSSGSAPFAIHMQVGQNRITEPAYEVIMKKHVSRIINKQYEKNW